MTGTSRKNSPFGNRMERARVLLRSVDRNERRTEEHSRQIVDLVLILDPDLRAAARRDGIKMPHGTGVTPLATYENERSRVEAQTPQNKEGSLHSRKICQTHSIFKEEYKPGIEGMIVDLHTGPLGGVTHLDIRLGDGELVSNVPVEYLRAA